MTTPSDTKNPASGVFDAAKAIVEALSKLDKPTQSLAMKFAAEILGLKAPDVALTATKSEAVEPAELHPPSGGGPTHSTDIKQFTAAKSPRSDQQFAAVVAYFYRFEAPEGERRDTIGAETLVEAARLAGRRRPAKAIFTLNNAKNAGYLDSAGSGEFRINSVGENLVAMALPGDDNGNSAKPKRKKATKKKATKKKSAKKSTATKKKSGRKKS